MIAIILFVCIIFIGVGAFFYIRRRNNAKKEEEAKATAAAAAAASAAEAAAVTEEAEAAGVEEEDDQSFEEKRKEIEAKFKSTKPPSTGRPEDFVDTFFEVVDVNKDDVLNEYELSLIPDEFRMQLMGMEKESKLGLLEDNKLTKQEMISLVTKMNGKPRQPKYQKYPDHDFTGGDISCQNGVEAAACEAKCDANDNCVSYIHTANDKICCIKHGTQNYKKLPGRQITGYIKNIDGYEVKQVGDRVAGDIGGPVSVNLPACKAKCDSLNNCVGISYTNNTCYAKQADGLVADYVNNGFQFYTKK